MCIRYQHEKFVFENFVFGIQHTIEFSMRLRYASVVLYVNEMHLTRIERVKQKIELVYQRKRDQTHDSKTEC